MSEVVASVKRVTDIISEISVASSEQSNGIEQINQAVTQMDEVTQQNAALVEEAAAAAGSLQEQAANLVASVSVFKLASTQSTTASPIGWKKMVAQKKTAARLASDTGRRIARKSSEKVLPFHRIAAATSGGEWEQF